MDDAGVPPPATDAAAAEPTSLWLPRDVLIASFLLGFPGGFGLVARNAWRIGRRSTARLILLLGAGIAAAYLFVVPDDLPSNVLIAVNAGVGGGLYSYTRGQHEAAANAGTQVIRASGRSGIATFLGGWLVTAGPSILLAIVLTSGAVEDPKLAGTVVFGTSGSGCRVTKAASIASGDPMYWVAYLSREAHDGEILSISQRAPGLSDTPQEMVVDGSAVCIANDGYAFALPTETITVEVTVGSERLAFGRVTLVSH